MEFHHADSAGPSTMEEAKLRNYYTYYIVPQEKRVPSLLESISNLQGETHKGNVGGLDHWYMGRNRGIDQARNQFHRQLNSLEQERRTVEAAAWRDEAMLMKDFVEHRTAYRNDFFSYSVLNPRGGA